MKKPRTHFCTVSAIHLGYRSICSAIKCPLEITADDYFVISNGAVYDAIQAAYIDLRKMGY